MVCTDYVTYAILRPQSYLFSTIHERLPAATFRSPPFATGTTSGTRPGRTAVAVSCLRNCVERSACYHSHYLRPDRRSEF
jgi:hypothetical protein